MQHMQVSKECYYQARHTSFHERAFLSRTQLFPHERKLWLRSFPTPLKKNPEYVPAYADSVFRGSAAMKHELIVLARTISDPTDRLNVVREYLQALIMRSLYESQAFRSIVFMGGTALRFLYNLPRYSEDLDFSRESAAEYEPVLWMQKIFKRLT